MCLFKLIISCAVLCISSKFLSGVYATTCVSSCTGVANGDYQSCLGCTVYASCSNGILYENRPCAASLVWDDSLKRCEYSSSTCPGGSTSTTTTTTPSTTTSITTTPTTTTTTTPTTTTPTTTTTTTPTTTTTTTPTTTTTTTPTTTTTTTPTTTTPTSTTTNLTTTTLLTTTQTACQNCCMSGELNINLTTSSGAVTGSLPGVNISRSISGPLGNAECSRTVRIAVDYDRLMNNDSCDLAGCFNSSSPFCRKRLLKVELSLSNSTRLNRLFNFGDSITNNGFGGDSSTQQNDAEIDTVHPNALIYPSDKCLPYSNARYRVDNVTATDVNNVTLYIGNEYVRIVSDGGHDFEVCDECLFALNGQSDSSAGGVNERIYVALNGIVGSATSRRGHGVCSARFTWACGFN